MPIRRRTLDRISIFVVVAGLSAAAFRFVPQFRAALLVASGRATRCPLERALAANDMITDHAALMASFKSKSRIIQRDGKIVLWDTPRGQFWMPEGSDDVLPSLLAEQERSIYGAGRQGARQGDIVLDCGAHVGVYSRVALKAGAKLVVAVEPSPLNLQCLRRNLKSEIDAGRVAVYEKGIWNEETVLTFREDARNSAGNMFLDGANSASSDIRVPVTTIDKLAAELNLERVDFIKMDIEGSEQKALVGAAQVLRRDKPRMAICTYHAEDDPQRVPEIVAGIAPDYKFDCGPCGEQDFRIIPHTLFFNAAGATMARR